MAKKFNLNLAQMAIKFCEIQPFMTSVIIGATTMEQLKLAVTSVDIDLTDEILADIDKVHLRAPNLCP